MDILSLTILVTTVYFLAFGVLHGLKRGALRSLFRLVLVGASFLIAWLSKKAYVSAVMNLEIEGSSLSDMLTEGLGDLGALGGIVPALVECMLSVVLFIFVFLALKIATLIVYGIFKKIFPKKNKRLGALVGLLQGALIAFAICAPLNGLICNVSQVMSLEFQGEALVPDDVKDDMKEIGIDFDEYTRSTICSVYSAVGNGFYKSLASSKMEGGESISLAGTVEAVEATAKFAEKIETITQIDMSAGLTSESKDQLRDTFRELNEIKNGMSSEAKETINTLISTIVSDAAGSADMPIPEEVAGMIENLDFETVDFEQEGNLVLDFVDYASGEATDVSVTDLVNELAESTVVLPMLENMAGESTPDVPEDMKQELSSAIAGLDDPEMADRLSALFGLN